MPSRLSTGETLRNRRQLILPDIGIVGRLIDPRDHAGTIVKAGDEIEFMNPDVGG